MRFFILFFVALFYRLTNSGSELKNIFMKGKITIEMDFDFGNPYIRVINNRESDDVRDKLISFFRQRLGHTSSWCTVRFDDTGISGNTMFEIHPLRPTDLQEQVVIMTEQARLNSINFNTVPSL